MRECREETGLVCRDLEHFLTFHPALDSLSNPSYLFFTDKFIETDEMERDGREVTLQEWVPFERAVEMIFSGEIVDSISILALMSYRRWSEREKRRCAVSRKPQS